jgi:hypothetical protein
MPTPEEELQDLLDGSNDDSAAEEKTSEKPVESSTIKQMRAQLRRLEKEYKAADAERTDLRKFKDEAVSVAQTSALTSSGLTPRQSEVFLKAYGDVSPENITAFKREVLGAEADDATSTPFQPTGAAGEHKSVVTKADLEKAFSDDPAKGWALLNSGKVQF